MASWMIHLRIADQLLERLAPQETAWIAGNLAPDCGTPNTNGTGFTPDKHVTHWTKRGKGECDYRAFALEYLPTENNPNRIAFYQGYTAHLMTDVLWVQFINTPTKARLYELYQADRDAYYHLVKSNWYNLDFLFLEQHPDFRAYRIFEKMPPFPNDYLDYYCTDALETQFLHIRSFYQNHTPDHQMAFPSLTMADADNFVLRASDIIAKFVLDHPWDPKPLNPVS